MYTNGRGPMMGGHRGPVGGPGMGHHTRMGFVPGMGFRPMRVHRRHMGLLPLGGLFLLPVLMFGGWFALAAILGIISLAGTVLGGVFRGLSHLFSGAFSGSGILIGIALGLLGFRAFCNRKAQEEESTATVDGEEVEAEIVEPSEHMYRNNY